MSLSKCCTKDTRESSVGTIHAFHVWHMLLEVILKIVANRLGNFCEETRKSNVDSGASDRALT